LQAQLQQYKDQLEKSNYVNNNNCNNNNDDDDNENQKFSSLRGAIRFMKSRALYAPMKQLNVASSTMHLNLIPVLRGLFDLFPESELTLLHKDEICRGLIAGMQDDGAEMRLIFNRVLADDSQYSAKEKSWLLTQLGIAHHKIAKVASMSADAVVSHQRSAEKFGAAIRFDENNAEAWRCWGWALDRISQHENDDNRRLELVRQSLEKYDRAIACDGTNAAVFDKQRTCSACAWTRRRCTRCISAMRRIGAESRSCNLQSR
jgi:hypothetical protein